MVSDCGRISESPWVLNCKFPLKPEPLREVFVYQLDANMKNYLQEGGVEGSSGICMSARKLGFALMSGLCLEFSLAQGNLPLP